MAGAASKQKQLAAMVERLPVPGPDDTNHEPQRPQLKAADEA